MAQGYGEVRAALQAPVDRMGAVTATLADVSAFVTRLLVADLHRVIQVLMGWKDEHQHRFRTHGRSYGIPAVGGLNLRENAEAVPLARFRFQPTETSPGSRIMIFDAICCYVP